MADQSNRGPINIPIESLDDAPDSRGPADRDEDVFEIDGDAVELEPGPFIFDPGDDVMVSAEATQPDVEAFVDTAENEPIPVTVEVGVEDVVDSDGVQLDQPSGDEDAEPAAQEAAASSSSRPPLVDIDPPVPAAAAVEIEDDAPTLNPEAEEAVTAEAGTPAPEISREAVFELMQELRQKTDALARLTDERSDLYDKLLRKQAEFENFRKRGEREMQEAYVRARADLLTDLLPVLDNFDLAMQHADNASADVIHEGMQLIHRQMLDSLLRLGLEPIDADGQPFDPELHEAVATEVSEEVPDHTVVNVLQRGYRLGDRLLRPARVKVAVQS